MKSVHIHLKTARLHVPSETIKHVNQVRSHVRSSAFGRSWTTGVAGTPSGTSTCSGAHNARSKWHAKQRVPELMKSKRQWEIEGKVHFTPFWRLGRAQKKRFWIISLSESHAVKKRHLYLNFTYWDWHLCTQRTTPETRKYRSNYQRLESTHIHLKSARPQNMFLQEISSMSKPQRSHPFPIFPAP